MDDDLRAYLQGVKDQVHAQYEVIDDRYKSVESNINTLYDVYGGDKDYVALLENVRAQYRGVFGCLESC
ncbi:hypothetical protein EMO92_04465 [Bifidobacterium reuteri]|uniref:Uncharacterized protein n=1 Tax=Bifidobacterium reuteri TaxID=983706 RepID=A0A5J5E8D4_9BIFI|nr:MULTISPECIES: hypothetical protein [Bifidobacterium]KAA8825725.1 hypothetical protein EMO92_04465 [Bifidobacterium reuteri]TPF77508.1 hypothetical protein BW09_09275 [Bifidobacterium sp. UTCIF-1]TPF79354.1 hypothetical protein BW08_10660 [Bifidobacterium sp. UTCIF-24]TPF81460.1 hypothetical protein BW12_09955 [Bifidobacterium sp. UTCIF-3]TPF84365.1 hypothetical protein BW07_05215 [Bifidobacterium sp. UTCIF-36]